jgi:DNA-binding GntR family transcriptional regulator
MTFSLAKLQKRSTEVQAADTLREAIVSGAIPLGSRLTEISMGEQLGVSRSTIRTALHQLVQEGLIIQVPYTGWTVMTVSIKDAWELYTLRASLEALAARLVATKVDQGEDAATIRATLAESFDRLQQACQNGNTAEIATQDMALHSAIVELSDHGRLRDQYARIQHQILIYIRSSDALISDPAQIVDQHRPLVEPIMAGDPEAAVRAAITHNETEGAILVDHLRSMSSNVG